MSSGMHAERALYKSPMKLKRALLTHTGAMLREALQEASARVAGVEGEAAAAQQVCIPKEPGKETDHIQKRPGDMGEIQAKARLEDEGLRLEEKTALAETRLRYARPKRDRDRDRERSASSSGMRAQRALRKRSIVFERDLVMQAHLRYAERGLRVRPVTRERELL